jgi:hypothetical protein
MMLVSSIDSVAFVGLDASSFSIYFLCILAFAQALDSVATVGLDVSSFL